MILNKLLWSEWKMCMLRKLFICRTSMQLGGAMGGPHEMPSSQRLGGIPRGGFKYKNKYLGFPWYPHGDFKLWCNVQMRVVFLWLRQVNMQLENIQGRVIWSRRMGASKVQWVKRIVHFFKRALCWTGWSSILNTSSSCLTLLPSNRKTEMRPFQKRKKNRPLKGCRQYLTHPAFTLYNQKTCKNKNNFRCFPFRPGYCKALKTELSVLQNIIAKPGPIGWLAWGSHHAKPVLDITKQTSLSFLMFAESSD